MSRRLPTHIELDLEKAARELRLWDGRSYEFARSKLGRDLAKEQGVRSLIELSEEQGRELLADLRRRVRG